MQASKAEVLSTCPHRIKLAPVSSHQVVMMPPAPTHSWNLTHTWAQLFAEDSSCPLRCGPGFPKASDIFAFLYSVRGPLSQSLALLPPSPPPPKSPPAAVNHML